MFLRCTPRKKNGKEHSYWSIVASRRLADGHVAQRHVLYLGEINDDQERAWTRSIQVFQDGQPEPQTVALFPEDRAGTVVDEASIVRLRLSELSVPRPRQWGACWLALQLWKELRLDPFWTPRLPSSRKGTRWDQILAVLTVYRLLAPGSEWRLQRQWFDRSAMADLLGVDFSAADPHKLYHCHDLLLAPKAALFTHLTQRWRDLFNASFEGLRYDLTSTYFESDPPLEAGDKRRFGYRRDQRPDCVQVVIGLIVTPQGFPLTYEVFSGNTSDKTTRRDFLGKIETQYGKARRIWVMDRGIPTEEVLAEMRASNPPVQYLVGTPKGRLSKLEKDLLDQPWQEARPGVTVKLLGQEGELYVLARSADRVAKERSMRRRQLKGLWKRLKELQAMKLRREELLMKLGAARPQAPSAWRLVEVEVEATQAMFTYRLNKDKLRQVRRREGRYLLRSNLTETDPAVVWNYYLQLVEVEQAFRNLKGDLAIRPIFHQDEARREAHIFVSFLAYCLHVTLGQWLRTLAPGLTARRVLEKFAAIQMVDIQIPTSDGRTLLLPRYTHPEAEQRLLLERLKLELPAQPPPRITVAPGQTEAAR
ncbi:MAG: IS1634 family transposase [Phycisphaerae bacterium]|nr:IS1634 family transposase [Phycisphaerae bacterium]